LPSRFSIVFSSFFSFQSRSFVFNPLRFIQEVAMLGLAKLQSAAAALLLVGNAVAVELLPISSTSALAMAKSGSTKLDFAERAEVDTNEFFLRDSEQFFWGAPSKSSQRVGPQPMHLTMS
jgi:hypothetical protein